MTADRSSAVTTGREARSRERRQRLLDATRELLRQDGWHNVAISDIGAAAGITGPAVYRHFRSKEELLVAALDHAAARLWSGLPDEDGRPARDLLAAYVDSHVAFAVENSDIIELWYQEARHLPKPARTAQRRLQRRYIERWNDVLLDCRPDLSADEARVMVRAAISLLHSIVHTDNLYDGERLQGLLRDMVMAALLRSADWDQPPAAGRR